MCLDVLSFETLSPRQAYEAENVHLAFRLQALARQRLRAIQPPRPGRADQRLSSHPIAAKTSPSSPGSVPQPMPPAKRFRPPTGSLCSRTISITSITALGE